MAEAIPIDSALRRADTAFSNSRCAFASREGGGRAEPGARAEPPPVLNEREVRCDLCALDPVCGLLDYGEGNRAPPEGILLRRQSLARGETIFRSGDPFRSLFAVKSGSFMTLIKGDTGPDQVIGFHFAGDLIGADGMARESYPTTARALEPSSVCELRMARLPQCGRPLESMQRAIIAILGEEVAFCQTQTATLIRRSGDQRLAAFFLGLSRRHAARGMPDSRFKLTMTRTDIASYLGLSRETVTRGLSTLQRAGAIGVSGRHIQIERHETLARLAGE